MSETDDDPDLLAGEYALGVLDQEAMAEVAARATREPSLAGAITAWEDRLTPLAALVHPLAPPPELWARIDASLPAPLMARPLPWRRVGFWQASTLGALALAAAFAALLLTRNPPQPLAPHAVATLLPANGQGPIFMAVMEADGRIAITGAAPVAVAPDRSLELWELPVGETRPRSLGVLPAGGARVVLAAGAGPKTQLMISLEPQGGSPTGQPTGPVLYAGTLTPLPAD